jgi:uncharacterized protein YehS (DUF1456 family)
VSTNDPGDILRAIRNMSVAQDQTLAKLADTERALQATEDENEKLRAAIEEAIQNCKFNCSADSFCGRCAPLLATLALVAP